MKDFQLTMKPLFFKTGYQWSWILTSAISMQAYILTVLLSNQARARFKPTSAKKSEANISRCIASSVRPL